MTREAALPTNARTTRWTIDVVVVIMTTSIGAAAVSVPLLIVDAGYGLASVGTLVAISAVMQFIARLGMSRLLEVFSTRTFVILAAALMATSSLILGLNLEVWMFVISQALQGIARAYFWSGIQTHVVRNAASSLGSLSRLNVSIGIGSLAGPVLAGFIASYSVQAAVVASGFLAIVGIAPALFLVRFAPFNPVTVAGDSRSNLIVARKGMPTAILMSSVAGAWYALLTSYIPVLLAMSGHSSVSIGTLVGIANTTVLLGSVAARWLGRLEWPTLILISVLPTGLGILVATLWPSSSMIVALCLAISGIGAGMSQTFAPALAADSVSNQERGRAIVSIGAFRSAAMLVVPLGVASIVIVGSSVAMATGIVAAVCTLPGLLGLKRKAAESAIENQ